MVSRYRVLVYIPDLVRDERINIAVVVYDDQTVIVRALSDWSRVEAFAGHPVDFEQSYIPHLTTMTPEQVHAWQSHYMSSLQLTEPRASTTSVEQSADRLAARFLVEPVAAE